MLRILPEIAIDLVTKAARNPQIIPLFYSVIFLRAASGPASLNFRYRFFLIVFWFIAFCAMSCFGKVRLSKTNVFSL